MCSIAAAGLVVAAVSAGISANSQNQNVKSQNAVNDAQHDNIMTAERTNLASLENVRQQNAADAGERINRNNALARNAEATATVSAGEANVSGVSVGELLRDLAGKAGQDNTDVESNYLRQDSAINLARENASTLSASQVNNLRTPAPVDWAGAAMNVAGAGVSSYSAAADRAARAKEAAGRMQ
jgi:hypothetical protein